VTDFLYLLRRSSLADDKLPPVTALAMCLHVLWKYRLCCENHQTNELLEWIAISGIMLFAGRSQSI